MNRVLGVIFTIIAVAAMVFAILNWGNYKSLIFTKADVKEDIPEATLTDTPEVVDDTLNTMNIPADSIATEGVEAIENINTNEPTERVDSLAL